MEPHSILMCPTFARITQTAAQFEAQEWFPGPQTFAKKIKSSPSAVQNLKIDEIKVFSQDALKLLKELRLL